MYERLRDLHRQGKLSESQLDAAVTKGWITAEQAEAIRSGA